MDDVLNNLSVDELKELFDESEELLEQATSFANIGKFSYYVEPLVYRNGQFDAVDTKEWKAYTEFKMLQLHVMLDTQEFNPQLQKGYERRVQVNAAPWNRKNPDGKYEKIPSDWEAILEPSIIEVTKASSVTEALESLKGKYVKVLDVKQQPTKRQPNPEYNTAKFVQVYSNREEAYADYMATKGGTASESAPAVEQKSYSDEVVNAVKMLSGLSQDAATIAKNIGANLTEEDVKTILGV